MVYYGGQERILLPMMMMQDGGEWWREEEKKMNEWMNDEAWISAFVEDSTCICCWSRVAHEKPCWYTSWAKQSMPFNKTKPVQGGGGFFPHPKYVWSPAGGWWGNTKHWRRNSVFAVATIGLLSAVTFMKSASIERRPVPPAWRIPSQSWCGYAKEDDPSLKWVNWARTKGCLSYFSPVFATS